MPSVNNILGNLIWLSGGLLNTCPVLPSCSHTSSGSPKVLQPRYFKLTPIRQHWCTRSGKCHLSSTFAYMKYQSSFPLLMYTFLQCANVEASDVILIKDEDDIRGCGAAEGETGRCRDV